jgi:prepilin-type N-terminal cleavage/methylation domain-containing protein
LNQAGVSMVEILAVLVIVGLLTVMAAPRINLTPFRAQAAVSQAGSTLLAASRAAVTRQHNVVVAVDEPGRRIRVHYDTDNDNTVDVGEIARWEPLPDGVVFGRAGAPAGRAGTSNVSFRGREGGLPAITFQRNGSASEEGGFYLTTANAVATGRAVDARMVVVDRATARPSWLTWNGSQWKSEF